jgi:hypothetical protein
MVSVRVDVVLGAEVGVARSTTVRVWRAREGVCRGFGSASDAWRTSCRKTATPSEVTPNSLWLMPASGLEDMKVEGSP